MRLLLLLVVLVGGKQHLRDPVSLSGSLPPDDEPPAVRTTKEKAEADWNSVWDYAGQPKSAQDKQIQAVLDEKLRLQKELKAEKQNHKLAPSKAVDEPLATTQKGQILAAEKQVKVQEDQQKKLKVLGAVALEQAKADATNAEVTHKKQEADQLLKKAQAKSDALNAAKPAQSVQLSVNTTVAVVATPAMRWKLASAFAATASILAAVLIAGKALVMRLDKNASETLRPGVAEMFHQLALFGVMGLFGYALLRSKTLERFNDHFLGEPGLLVTTMMYDIGTVLLTGLVFFFIFSVQLIVFAINIKNKWRSWEQLSLYTTEKTHSMRKKIAQANQKRHRGCQCSGNVGHDRDDVNGFRYRLTRKGFVSRDIGRHGVLAQDFDFASYLEVPLGETLTATISILSCPITVLCFCVMLALTTVLIGATAAIQFFVFFGWGCSGMLFAVVVRSQLNRLRTHLYIEDPHVPGDSAFPTPQMLSEGTQAPSVHMDSGGNEMDVQGPNTAWQQQRGKGRVSKVAHKQHWYLVGGEYGGVILHGCYRLILLWASVYAAFYVLVFSTIAPTYFAHTAGTVCAAIICAIPPFFMMTSLAGSVGDHAMFCSIEFMRREDVVDQVISAARLRKGRIAVRLVRSMHVVAEHKRLWALNQSGGKAEGVVDASDGIAEMKLAPSHFLGHHLYDMVMKGFNTVDPKSSGELGVDEVWHMLRWLGYDLTEFEVKYLCHGPPRSSIAEPDVAARRCVTFDGLLAIVQKLVVLHHSIQMLENVVVAAVRDEFRQHDLAQNGKKANPDSEYITTSILRKNWLDRPVPEKIMENLLLRYTTDPDTVRALRRQYRLMMNTPMEAVDGAAEITHSVTAGDLARLLKEQMDYLNSTSRSKVGLGGSASRNEERAARMMTERTKR